jgi:hypothetical protein
MNIFDIVLSFVAEDDIDGVYHYIADVLMSPLAAIDYRNGI